MESNYINKFQREYAAFGGAELTAVEKAIEEIVIAVYGNDPHSWGQQRDGLRKGFELLWPYVGKAFEAGQDYHHFSDGPGPYAPDKEKYLTQVLTELKSKKQL
jgi:hypothetical protein